MIRAQIHWFTGTKKQAKSVADFACGEKCEKCETLAAEDEEVCVRNRRETISCHCVSAGQVTYVRPQM